MQVHHLELGTRGEEMAVEWLRRHHLNILERNWRSGKSEVDIVVKENNTIVFVEVKTRSGNQWSEPESSVDSKKQKALIRAASDWFDQYPGEHSFRFDVIAVQLLPEKKVISHFRDAFFPIS